MSSGVQLTGERTTASGPYRVSTQLNTFTGSALTSDGLPRPEARPTQTMERSLWFEADGREVTDPARFAVLEARLATDQGEFYEPAKGREGCH